MTTAEIKPIVDPEGEWLWVPFALAVDSNAAVVYAKDYWPGKPCYEPWPPERLSVVAYDDADEDGKATLDEYGGDGVAVPSSEGDVYWPIRCYPTDDSSREECSDG